MYQCPTKRDTVCGSDGKTYTNQCELDRFNCDNKRSGVVTKKHDGDCGMLMIVYKYLKILVILNFGAKNPSETTRHKNMRGEDINIKEPLVSLFLVLQ